MIRRPPRSTLSSSSAASDVYKRQVLADGHPGILQDKIGDDVFDGKQQHPSDQRTNRNRRGHKGKRQADALARLRMGTDRRRSAQLLLKPGQIDRYWPFMTSPGPECTCRELEKRQDDAGCGPIAICDGFDPAPRVRLPEYLICNLLVGGYHRQTGKLSFFFRYLRSCSGDPRRPHGGESA